MKKIFVLFLILILGCSSTNHGFVSYETKNDYKEPKIGWIDYSPGTVSVAKKQKKPIIFYFKSNNCDECDQMQEFTLSDSLVIYLINNNFTPILVKKDSSYFSGLSSKYEVKVIPFIVILAHPAFTIELVRVNGYIDAEDYVDVLDTSYELNKALNGESNNFFDILLKSL